MEFQNAGGADSPGSHVENIIRVNIGYAVSDSLPDQIKSISQIT